MKVFRINQSKTKLKSFMKVISRMRLKRIVLSQIFIVKTVIIVKTVRVPKNSHLLAVYFKVISNVHAIAKIVKINHQVM
jgi:hypothetical protein